MLDGNIIINNGHDAARIIREIEPGGGEADYVTHAVVSTGRVADYLFEHGRISHDQYLAATMLRDDYEAGRPSMSALPAQDPAAPYVSGGGSEPISFGDEERWRKYRNAIRQLGRDWKSVIRFVVIEDKYPEAYGAATRSQGMAMLVTGLDKLVQHYGLVARGKRG